ncbi:DUF983 domain-containing protein [Pontibacter vulgaris]|uniref:DUF983 domain-containing protein n=1 Tax=Pontibacter vulgaris TaxID=2905679 RepID=UPI001FA781A9|nr:DUF983 domain-containing protein [Pontibacter vulgaris]
MAQPSKLGAIVGAKCPRCRKGDVFTHSAFNLTKFDKMYEQCPVCGFHYEVEVGFFWGAMYVSYGFSVAIVLLVGILLYYLANDPPTWVYVTVVAVVVLLFTPVLFRYARILMLHFFGGVDYDPGYNKR